MSILVIDRENLVDSTICAGLCTDCNITAYAVHAMADTTCLINEVQPDLLVLELGNAQSTQLASFQWILSAAPCSCILIHAETDNRHIDDSQTPASRIAMETVGYMTQSSTVKHFALALGQVCSALLRTEPEMAHQFVRTWRHASLTARISDGTVGRRLKVLVLACKDESRSVRVKQRRKGERWTWKPNIGLWGLRPIDLRTRLVYRSLGVAFLHLVHQAGTLLAGSIHIRPVTRP